MKTTVVAIKKVKEMIKGLGFRMSPLVPEALDAHVRKMIEAAANHASKHKGRKIKVEDLIEEGRVLH